MQTHGTNVVGTMILALGFCFVVGGSAPTKAETAKASEAAKTSSEAQALTKFSQAGNSAIQAIRGARLAIFNGDPKAAKDMVEKAKTSVENATKDAPMFDTATTMSVQGKVVGSQNQKVTAAFVPVDGQFVLADDFVLTPEKQAHIDKANEHLKKGESKEALDELHLADIDVNYSRVWMSIAGAQSHLDQAIKLMNEGKYYEANLALKAIEDSLTIDSVTLAETPKKQS
jgi:ribosomal protein L7/L12